MIYIIDDDQYVRDGFSLLLKSAGYESKSFESVEEFLQVFNPDENDLLILDINMPGMSGCDLLEILKKKGIHIPVIIVTAYADEKSKQFSRNYGVLAYLRKPIDSAALIDMITYSIQRNSTNQKNISHQDS